ncbi:hypothetical protein, partial [Erythrobacter sp. YJ-T3-07]|uniref:hypothetical protein n=1 Tax=Erythrobacter sp. YJ-T3-07 TaxID=2793063 RepID=UPI001F1F3526
GRFAVFRDGGWHSGAKRRSDVAFVASACQHLDNSPATTSDLVDTRSYDGAEHVAKEQASVEVTISRQLATGSLLRIMNRGRFHDLRSIKSYCYCIYVAWLFWHWFTTDAITNDVWVYNR